MSKPVGITLCAVLCLVVSSNVAVGKPSAPDGDMLWSHFRMKDVPMKPLVISLPILYTCGPEDISMTNEQPR